MLQWIKSNIDDDCVKWLSGVEDRIDGLIGGEYVSVGHGRFNTATVSAFTNNNPKYTDSPPGFGITINDIGGFFASGYIADGKIRTLEPGGYTGGSNQAQVYILLHELAHSLEAADFKNDFGLPSAGRANDKPVNQNCRKTINAAGSIR